MRKNGKSAYCGIEGCGLGFGSDLPDVHPVETDACLAELSELRLPPWAVNASGFSPNIHNALSHMLAGDGSGAGCAGQLPSAAPCAGRGAPSSSSFVATRQSSRLAVARSSPTCRGALCLILNHSLGFAVVFLHRFWLHHLRVCGTAH